MCFGGKRDCEETWRMQKVGILLVIAVAVVHGQKIETAKPDRTKVIRVQTAANHLSVIELAEPVTEVAAGSPAYKVEWHGNKVFVQPLEPEATTNLFIWTASGRLSYELAPARSVEDMHFAIDQELPPETAKTTSAGEISPTEASAGDSDRIAEQLLLGSTPVRFEGHWKQASRVNVLLSDVYREGNRVYVRYAIRNDSRAAYIMAAPEIFRLRAPRSRRSLIGLNRTQILGNSIGLKSSGESAIEVVGAEINAAAVSPGSTSYGLVAFEIPPELPSHPTVLRFHFPSDTAGDVSALLVL